MMRHYLLRLMFVLGLATLGSSICWAGKVYKWVDEDGVTHFTQYAPPNQTVQTVDSSNPQSAANSTQKNDNNSPDANESPIVKQFESLQKQLEKESSAKQEALKEQQFAKIKQENCIKGKNNLAELLRSPRIRLKQKDGEVKLLTEEERNAKIDYARNTIKQNCDS